MKDAIAFVLNPTVRKRPTEGFRTTCLCVVIYLAKILVLYARKIFVFYVCLSPKAPITSW